MNRILASVGILTFNSASTLRRALESVYEFDDIVICDGGSTDDTLDIAREFGARIIAQDSQFKNPDGSLKNFGGVRNQCLDAAKYDWFLYIDSDETASAGLVEEIRNVVASNDSALVYRVPIGIMMDGRYIKYSSNYPGYQHRFFSKRSGAHFIKPVHERIEFDQKLVQIGTLEHPWYVHSTKEDWNNYLSNSSEYRTDAILRAAQEPFSIYLRYTAWWHLRASLAVVIKSLRNYLFHGFKDSIPLRGEFGRALVPLVLIWRVTACRLKLFFKR